MALLVLAGFLVAAICLGLLGFGAITMWRGLRGVIVDRDPRCLGCGYLLIGLPMFQSNCPECGLDISDPRAIRHGRRRLRGRPVLIGLLIMLVSLGPFLVPLIPKSALNMILPPKKAAPVARANSTLATGTSAAPSPCPRCGRIHADGQSIFGANDPLAVLTYSPKADSQEAVLESFGLETGGSQGDPGKKSSTISPPAFSPWPVQSNASRSTFGSEPTSEGGFDSLAAFSSRRLEPSWKPIIEVPEIDQREADPVMPAPTPGGGWRFRGQTGRSHGETGWFVKQHSSDGASVAPLDVTLAGGGFVGGYSTLQLAPEPTRDDQHDSLRAAPAPNSGGGGRQFMEQTGHAVGTSEWFQWQFSSGGGIGAQCGSTLSQGTLPGGYSKPLGFPGSHATLVNKGLIRPGMARTAFPSAITCGRPVGGKVISR